jgi:hypothetical protein
MVARGFNGAVPDRPLAAKEFASEDERNSLLSV